MILYHEVPAQMHGTILYPLNQLNEINSDRHQEAVKKYAGREFVRDQWIQLLKCLWNDVIFLSPIHPQKIIDKRAEHGLQSNVRSYFEIESDVLSSWDKLLIYRHRPEWLVKKEGDIRSEYLWLSRLSEPKKAELAAFPEVGEWALKKFGKENFFYGNLPHVLYPGTIETRGLKIIQC